MAHLVKALWYKLEGRGFDSRLCQWNFTLTYSFRPHCGPAVNSPSNRKELQEYFLGRKGDECIGLAPSGSVQGLLYLYFAFVILHELKHVLAETWSTFVNQALVRLDGNKVVCMWQMHERCTVPSLICGLLVCYHCLWCVHGKILK
jgi:hypothetical protein